MTTGLTPEGAPTPQVAAYLGAKEETARGRQQIWRRVALALGLALTISVGTNVYGAVTSGQIRSTQVSNTEVNHCEERSFDAILKDARLAFAGDRNAADYSKAPKKC